MAAPIVRPLVAWQAVATGNRAYLDLPLDRDYENITITGAAATKTDLKDIISNIRLVVNGKPIREISVTDQRQLNGRFGAIYNTTDLLAVMMHFREDWLWNHAGADALCLFTAGLMSVRIEVDILPGLTGLSLGGYYTAKNQRAFKPGTNWIRKYRTDVLDFSATGKKPFRNIAPVGDVKAFTIVGAAITDAKYTISDAVLMELPDDASQSKLLAQNEMIADANYFVLPFDADLTFDAGFPAAAVKESVLEVGVSATGSYKLIQEYFEPLN